MIKDPINAETIAADRATTTEKPSEPRETPGAVRTASAAAAAAATATMKGTAFEHMPLLVSREYPTAHDSQACPPKPTRHAHSPVAAMQTPADAQGTLSDELASGHASGAPRGQSFTHIPGSPHSHTPLPHVPIRCTLSRDKREKRNPPSPTDAPAKRSKSLPRTIPVGAAAPPGKRLIENATLGVPAQVRPSEGRGAGPRAEAEGNPSAVMSAEVRDAAAALPEMVAFNPVPVMGGVQMMSASAPPERRARATRLHVVPLPPQTPQSSSNPSGQQRPEGPTVAQHPPAASRVCPTAQNGAIDARTASSFTHESTLQGRKRVGGGR